MTRKPKTKVVAVRVSLEDKEFIQQQAKSQNLTVSKWLGCLMTTMCHLAEGATVQTFDQEFRKSLKDIVNRKTINAENEFTYIIGDERNRVKIGWSSNPQSRLKNLQSSTPDKLTMILILKGNCEKELHYLFESDRIHLEWFHFSEKIRAFVEENHGVVK